MERIQTTATPDNGAIWISSLFGIELKINVSDRSISALKRFIEVLEYTPKDTLSLDDYTVLVDTLESPDIALAKEAMNTHVHVNTEQAIEYIKKADSICIANPTDFNPQTIVEETKYKMSYIKTDAECIKDNSLKPAPSKVFTEIEPFKEVPVFTYQQTDLLKQVGKNAVFCNNHDGIIAIRRAQYKINIFTTIEEINRMKSLPEMTVKLTLQDYEKRTYPNKAVVLRHFLRDLKDVSELKVDFTKPKIILWEVV